MNHKIVQKNCDYSPVVEFSSSQTTLQFKTLFSWAVASFFFFLLDFRFLLSDLSLFGEGSLLFIPVSRCWQIWGRTEELGLGMGRILAVGGNGRCGRAASGGLERRRQWLGFIRVSTVHPALLFLLIYTILFYIDFKIKNLQLYKKN